MRRRWVTYVADGAIDLAVGQPLLPAVHVVVHDVLVQPRRAALRSQASIVKGRSLCSSHGYHLFEWSIYICTRPEKDTHMAIPAVAVASLRDRVWVFVQDDLALQGLEGEQLDRVVAQFPDRVVELHLHLVCVRLLSEVLHEVDDFRHKWPVDVPASRHKYQYRYRKT